MHGDRPADLRYLIQLAQAAEINGFEAVLTPTGLWCEDAWLTTAMLINSTESLKYLVAFRPGLISPDAGRADGVDLSMALPGPAAAERGHRRRKRRAAGVRRLPGSGTVTRDVASSSTSSAGCGRPTIR